MALAILRADVFEPMAIEAHEVAEAAAFAVEGVIEKSGVGGGMPGELGRIVAEVLEHQCED